MSSVALERGWTELSAFDTEQILRGVIYGEKPRVSLTDLVALVSGEHGDVLQRDFVDALSRGAKHPSSGLHHSFSSLCVLAGNLEPLLALANASDDVRINGASVTKSQWLDVLSTRSEANGMTVTTTLFEQGVTLDDPYASKVIAFALEHQPRHRCVDLLLARGGRETSLIAAGLLNRRLACDAASHASRAAPAPRRRLGI